MLGYVGMTVQDLVNISRLPRGSTYTTVRELGPIIPPIVWYFGAQFPNSCIYGPSGLGDLRIWGFGRVNLKPDDMAS